MENRRINRDLIHIVSRHSNWEAQEIEAAFSKYGIYADARLWSRFLNLLLPGAGVALAVSGIIFFFAYNWASMHKFFKLGLVGSGMVACVVIAILPRIPELIRNISLAAASVLVGGLFAVFGQIYQTGADTYDFFLGWSVFVAIWVLVSGFPPLWLIGMCLLNTTVTLYYEQVSMSHGQGYLNILFIINAVAVLATEIRRHNDPALNSGWFVKTVALAAICEITMAMCLGLWGSGVDDSIAFLLGITGLCTGFWYGMRTESVFYISSVGFSAIVVMTTIIIKGIGSDPIGVFFIVSIFLIGSTTMLIRHLIHLSKQWHGNNRTIGPDESGQPGESGQSDTTES